MYLENFQFPIENKRVYPYDLLAQKGLEHVIFAPITIFYGNNGSGKSTLLLGLLKSMGTVWVKRG